MPARMIGGLGVCFLGASIVSPPLFSPRLTLEGPVAGFHQVTAYRSSSHFEFSVNPNGHLSGVLRAHYFDKGYYFGDPVVSDGDVVRVSYFTWTNDVLEMRETKGRHAGWTYREDENGVGPWILCALGAYLFFGGIISWLFSDMAVQPDTAG